MRVNEFLQRQLSTAGWAPIEPGLARFMAPEIHSEHEISVWLTVPDALQRKFPRTVLVKVRIDGFGIVPILTRSTQDLAERIGYVSGGEVELIIEPAQLRSIAAKAPAENPPRPCKECDNLTNGGNCLAARQGKLPGKPTSYCPNPAHLRRCIEYKPHYFLVSSERPDHRTGRELWPETAAASLPGDDLSAQGKAVAMLSDLLRDGPKEAAEILAAAEGANISERTMQRAAEQLDVRKTKGGLVGGWTWALPEEEQAAA